MRSPRLTLVGEERDNVLKVINDGIATRPVLPDYLSLEPVKEEAFSAYN